MKPGSKLHQAPGKHFQSESERLDTTHLRQHLPKLEAKAVRLREKELRARRRAEKIELQIHGIRLLIGAERGDPPASGASSAHAAVFGVAAIRRVLREAPNRVWSAGELHLELEQRGWVSRTARHRLQGTEAAVSRLVRSGELERIERGRYRLSSLSSPNGRSLLSQPHVDPPPVRANGGA